jgi:2,5-furandicarboxylate decarboxylase 1
MRTAVVDLRTALEACEKQRELICIRKEVEPYVELPSIMNAVGHQDRPCALLFENIKNYPNARAAAKFLGGPQRFGNYYGLATDFKTLKMHFLEALENPIAPRTVSGSPPKENIRLGPVDITEIIPPVKGALNVDSLYYQPVVVTKDPRTGVRNTGIYRAAVQGPGKLTVNARTDRHGGLQLTAARAHNLTVPAALIIGVEPAVWIAANAKVPYGYDELSYAGAIKGSPVDLVKCETIDLDVPANAEIIIEGEFRPPFELGVEGPWPEYLKYLGMQINPPIMHVTAVTFRTNPINYVSIPASGRGDEALGLPNQAQLLRLLREFASDFVVDAFLTPVTLLHHAIIKVKKSEPHHEGLQINVALTAFSFSPTLDTVTLVDEDINIHDLADIDWAISTRCNPAKQVHILPEGRTTQIVPIAGVRELDHEPIVKAKMIVDATIPWNYKTREISSGLTFFSKTTWLDVNLSDYLGASELDKLKR